MRDTTTFVNPDTVHRAVRRIWKGWDEFSAFEQALRLFNTTQAIEAYLAEAWQPIEQAPTDGSWVIVFAPPRAGLPAMVTAAQYAGWCIDEIRKPTLFQPLPIGPITKAEDPAPASEDGSDG